MVQHQPYQIDFRGQWSLTQRRLVTDAIVEVEMQQAAEAIPAHSKHWVCQQHRKPKPRFFAHHIERSIVLQAASAQALAGEIRRWGQDPDVSMPAS